MFKVITIFFFCFCAIGAFAQSNSKDDKGLDLPNGFRAGYLRSNMVNDTADSDHKLSRFYVGYLRKVKIIPFIHAETGLEYMITGAERTNDTRLELHYLVLPVQGIFKIGPFVAIAGLNGNFRVAENYTVNGEKVKRSGHDKSSAFDFALDAGAGFNFTVLTIEYRYYWGLSEVDNGWYNKYAELGLKLHF